MTRATAPPVPGAPTQPTTPNHRKRGRPPKLEELRPEVRSVKMTQAEFDALYVIATRNQTTIHGLLKFAIRRVIACLSLPQA